MSEDKTTALCRELRELRAAWLDEPSIAPHMGNAPGYTTGTAVRLCGDAADEIDRLEAENEKLREALRHTASRAHAALAT